MLVLRRSWPFLLPLLSSLLLLFFFFFFLFYPELLITYTHNNNKKKKRMPSTGTATRSFHSRSSSKCSISKSV